MDPTTTTIDSLRRWGRGQLNTYSSSEIDVTVLLCHSLGVSAAYLITHDDCQISAELEDQFRLCIDRRMRGEPVAYIVGEREFWSLPITVNNAVLIPRPDTETLVEETLKLVESYSGNHILELGAGSGAIALAFASQRPTWNITATDISVEALDIARSNQGKLGLDNIQWIVSDWFDQLSGLRFDAICSNPPYIAEDDHHLLSGDVRFEPLLALKSGSDGLDDLRNIISSANAFLNSAGWLILEHGFDQSRQVREMFADNGFSNVKTVADLSGNDRVTLGQWFNTISQ